MTSRLKGFAGIGRYVLAALLIIGAMFLWTLMPDRIEAWAPLNQQGVIGKAAQARNFTVTVVRALSGDAVRYKRSPKNPEPATVSGKGTWIVVRITYKSERRVYGQADAAARLRIGAREYQPTLGSTDVQELVYRVPGRPTAATFLIRRDSDDNEALNGSALDSLIVVELPLPSEERRNVIDLERITP